MSDAYRSVLENAREEVLSGDLNRLQQLTSTERLNVERDMARGYDSSWNTQPTSANGAQANATGATLLPTLTHVAGWDMSVSAGQLLADDGTAHALNSDTSSLKVVRWDTTTVTTAAAAVNPRIDLIVVTQTTVDTDLTNRYVLLDPVARTVVPTPVNKTRQPLGVVSLIPGIAAANPVPPAVPAGSIALFEVLVKTTDASAATVLSIRRVYRRVEFPLSAVHAVLQGGEFEWTDADETLASCYIGLAGDATPGLAIRTHGVHKFVINGEVVYGLGDGAVGVPGTSLIAPVTQDQANDPFAVVALPGSDRPYYLYAVGGRDFTSFSDPVPNAVNPRGSGVRIVESLTPPTKDGVPSIQLSILVGGVPTAVPIHASLYVGVGFVYRATTRRKTCIQSGDEIWAASGGFWDTATYTPGGAPIDMSTWTVTPAPVTATKVCAVATNANPAGFASDWRFDLLPYNARTSYSYVSGEPHLSLAQAAIYVAATIGVDQVSGWVPMRGNQVRLVMDWTGMIAPTAIVIPSAFNMNVPRIGR